MLLRYINYLTHANDKLGIIQYMKWVGVEGKGRMGELQTE